MMRLRFKVKWLTKTSFNRGASRQGRGEIMDKGVAIEGKFKLPDGTQIEPLLGSRAIIGNHDFQTLMQVSRGKKKISGIWEQDICCGRIIKTR